VVDALAVSPGGLTRTQVGRLLERAGHRIGARSQATTSEVNAFLTDLSERVPLQGGSRWSLDAAEQEERLRASWRDGTYGSIVEAVEVVDPWSPPSLGGDARRPGANLRELRRAWLTGDDERLGRCASGLGRRDSLAAWIQAPFPTDLFAAATPFGRCWALDRALADSEPLFDPLPDELGAMIASLPDDRSAARVRARWAAHQGDWEALGRALELVDDDELPLLRGLHALMSGRAVPACRLLERGLADHRRSTRSDLPDELAAHVVPLAWILAGGARRLGRAQRLLELGIGPDAPPVTAGWSHLMPLVEPDAFAGFRPDHPLGFVPASLAAYWRGEPPPLGVEEAREALLHAGMPGWAAELGDASVLRPLRAPRSPWRDLVDRLGDALPPSVGTDADQRLQWTLTVHGRVPHLEARHQHLRDGVWSKGRKVSPARLAALDSSLPLSEADRRLASALTPGPGRGQPLRWAPASTWRELADHPGIVDEQGRAVTVTCARPALHVDEDSDRVTVRLQPDLGDAPVAVERVGDDFHVYVVPDELQAAAQVLAGGLTLPAEAREALAPLLARLRTAFAPPTPRTAVDGDPTVGLWLRPRGSSVHGRLGVLPAGGDADSAEPLVPGDGAVWLLARRGGGSVRVARDLDAERTLAGPVRRAMGVDEHTHERVLGLDEALALLAWARDHGVPCHWPQGGALRLRRPRADAHLSLRSDGPLLRPTGRLALDEGEVPVRALLPALVDEPEPFVRLDDGSFLQLEGRLRDALRALARLGDRQGRVHPLALPTLRGLAGPEAVRPDAEVRAILERLEAPYTAPDVPRALGTELRPYQEEAYRWLLELAHRGLGGILADDMGLGKTVTLLAVLLRRRAEGPALVVAPTSVAGSWERQAQRFAPDLRLHRLGRDPMPESPGPTDLVVASYGLLVHRAEALQAVPWSTVVFDESQALKNPSTQRFRAAAGLRADLRVGLSGTPVENHLADLHAQMSLLVPGLLGPRTRFLRRFAAPDELLRRLVGPFLLRRTKQMVLDELPPRIDDVLRVEPGPQEASLYAEEHRAAVAAAEGGDAVAVLAQLTRLRRLACSPALQAPSWSGDSAKTRAFRRLARDLHAAGHRALVFSQFLDHLALLRAVLDEEGLGHAYLDGSTPAAARDEAVRTFQQGDLPFFLISLRAGGTGLTLTAADYVLHMDPWWNPAVEDQASDRAHRIGQRRTVTTYRVVTAGTIEERILQLHHRKRRLAEQLLQGSEVVSRLSADELRALLVDDGAGIVGA
jgi:superfamily II DNA or RNA helicase